MPAKNRVFLQLDPDSRPSTVGPAFTGHFRVTADTPRGLQPIYPAVPLPTTGLGGPHSSNALGTPKPPPANLDLSKNIYGDALTQSPRKHGLEADEEEGAPTPPAKKPKHNCATCGVDCTRVRYHSTKTTAMEICPNCYIEGRFPSNMYSGDFLKLEDRPVKQGSEDDWTEQETLLLLEGIELFDEDWTKVSDHVGTRTRDQCVLKFLQLPIEDPYVGVKTSDLGPLQYHRVPFSAADNPVLSLTAFLAAVVDPKVAAAAAKAAVQELENEKGNKPAAESHSAKPDEVKENGSAHEVADVEKNGADASEVGGSDDVDVKGKGKDLTDAMDMDQPQSEPTSEQTAESHDMKTTGRPDATLQKAAATAIGSAAAKSHVLGKHATSELHALTLALIQTQMRKLETKMTHFEEMEAVLENERKELEREKQKLYADRLAFRKMVASWEGKVMNKENYGAEMGGVAEKRQGGKAGEVLKGSTFEEVGTGITAVKVNPVQDAEAAQQHVDPFLISIGQ